MRTRQAYKIVKYTIWDYKIYPDGMTTTAFRTVRRRHRQSLINRARHEDGSTRKYLIHQSCSPYMMEDLLNELQQSPKAKAIRRKRGQVGYAFYYNDSEL